MTSTTSCYRELDNRPIIAILHTRNYGTIIARDENGVKQIKSYFKILRQDIKKLELHNLKTIERDCK